MHRGSNGALLLLAPENHPISLSIRETFINSPFIKLSSNYPNLNVLCETDGSFWDLTNLLHEGIDIVPGEQNCPWVLLSTWIPLDDCGWAGMNSASPRAILGMKWSPKAHQMRHRLEWRKTEMIPHIMCLSQKWLTLQGPIKMTVTMRLLSHLLVFLSEWG